MIKSDINLIPKKVKKPLSVSLGIPVAIILLAGILLAGIYFPQVIINNMKNDLSIIEKELGGYEDVQNEYALLTQKLLETRSQIKGIEDFYSLEINLSEMFSEIDRLIPTGITINQYEFMYEGIIISGTGENDLRIAELENRLWETAFFEDIFIAGISGDEGQRSFSFRLTYKSNLAGR